MKISTRVRQHRKNDFRHLLRDQSAVSAVEFAILAGPFIFLLLGVLQLGIFYMAQSALDNGVIKTAETLHTNFTSSAGATSLDASGLRAIVSTNAGGMISNDASLKVEIRPLDKLSISTVPIVNGTADYGTPTSTLVVRAQSTIITFAPGLSGLSLVSSSALVRRQGS